MNIIISAFAFLSLAQSAFAQEHDHGKRGTPDWYDPMCCDRRHCKPVPDSDVEFTTDPNGNFVARYKPTGNLFYRPQFKSSQDERYHVCINYTNEMMSLCFYDRPGA